jgi:hypothetical protein
LILDSAALAGIGPVAAQGQPDPVQLVLFPEMDARADVPEITEKCWDILGIETSGGSSVNSSQVTSTVTQGRSLDSSIRDYSR